MAINTVIIDSAALLIVPSVIIWEELNFSKNKPGLNAIPKFSFFISTINDIISRSLNKFIGKFNYMIIAFSLIWISCMIYVVAMTEELDFSESLMANRDEMTANMKLLNN